jgi:outer membrane protein TolC
MRVSCKSSLGLVWIACAALTILLNRAHRATAETSAASDTLRTPRLLTLDDSVRYTLAHNPQLTALREQHGIAAAGVVIAKTYPFNPIYQGSFQDAHGSSGSVENPFLQQHQVTLEVELRHQRSYREQAAFAALSRTDWEIAVQEMVFAINAIRAFDAVLYRQGKLAVSEEALRLNQQGADQARLLVERGTLKSGDLIVSRAEVSDVQSQLGLNRITLIGARRDYYRALGISDGSAEPTGEMERSVPIRPTDFWLSTANELRPELFARGAAVREAGATAALQRANRFGNPAVGPFYEFDNSRVTFIGAQVQVAIPVLNCHTGEIRQAEAQLTQAQLNVRQTEVEIWQDVTLAAANVAEAQQSVESYRREILPSLRKGLEDTELLFEQGQGGVDVLRVLDVRRKLLKAEDGYLDALLAYTTAIADLAQAVGDPSVAMGQYQSTDSSPEIPAASSAGMMLKQP